MVNCHVSKIVSKTPGTKVCKFVKWDSLFTEANNVKNGKLYEVKKSKVFRVLITRVNFAFCAVFVEVLHVIQRYQNRGLSEVPTQSQMKHFTVYRTSNKV